MRLCTASSNRARSWCCGLAATSASRLSSACASMAAPLSPSQSVGSIFSLRGCSFLSHCTMVWAINARVSGTCSMSISLASASSSSAWWRPLCVRAPSTVAMACDRSTRPIRARAALTMKCSTCRSCAISSAADSMRATCWPSRRAFSGTTSHCASSPTTSWRRIRATSESASKNLSRTKCARFWPMRSLLRGMMAVCRAMNGIGTRRNSARTANQSASAPTMAASEMALRQSMPRLRGAQLVSANTSVTPSSNARARALARRRAAACSDMRHAYGQRHGSRPDHPR